uniref:Uncharacterized protein n=1 Tax=Leersia perrieri TaxID=77586 RepID=A0A0D9WSU4_9ORYZ
MGSWLAVASMPWTTRQQVHADGGAFGSVRSTAAVDTSYAQHLDQRLKDRPFVTARPRLHHATVDPRGAKFHVIIGRRHRASTAS